MLKPNQFIKKRWSKRYSSLGYFPNEDGFFNMNVCDLVDSSPQKVILICDNCGEEYVSMYRTFMNHQKNGDCDYCKTCVDKLKSQMLYPKIKAKCDAYGCKLITPMYDITNYHSRVEYECQKHGLKTMTAGNMALGRGCADCAKENNRSRFSFTRNEIESQVKECGGYLINGWDYVNNHTKNLFVACPICYTPFVTSLVAFTQHGGQLCAKCSHVMSLGEQKVEKYLREHQYVYTKQKWFYDCRDTYPLPFDFYLESEKTVIEFDGRQHYFDTGYFTHDLKKISAHDDIKNNYCKKNDINIIRIPYWDINNIDTILDSQLSHNDIV